MHYTGRIHAGTRTYDPVTCEEHGFEHGLCSGPPASDYPAQGERPIICLLIPDSDNDKICMFDPYSGEYFGDFIFDDTSATPQYDLQTPLNAVQGPGPEINIYVSDQVSDAVYVFDPGYGTYLYTYADTSDGLNNVRGIAFRDDHLFVSCGDYHVMEFDGPHSFARYFIQDGSSPFDIFFLEDDRALLSDIQGTADNVRLYDTNGTFIQQLFTASTPEQIQQDTQYPDTFYNCSFAENLIRSFLIDGTVLSAITFPSPRGVYCLGNRNLLVTNDNGVFEIDPANGSVIEQEYDQSARFIELVCLTVGVRETSYYPVPCRISAAPNPFSQRTVISYVLDRPSHVDASIYSVHGQRIATLIDGPLPAGQHSCIWDGKDARGTVVNPGVYFIRLAPSYHRSITKKLLYVK